MRNAEAQAHLIDDVLDITRIINQKLHLDREVHPVAEIVTEAVEAVQPSADAKKITLSNRTETNGLLVNVDGRRLQQVLLNLLTNAVKFTPKGGRIAVRLARRNDSALIEISDTGKGINAELLPHVFERFRQGDSSSTRQHGGLGLGLAIAQQLVAMHNGRIEVESGGDGQGSRFTVLLPLVPAEKNVAPEQQPSRHTESISEHTLLGLHILVVDDEASVRDLLTVALSKCGASVSAAGSVAEALESIRALKPDVIVTDIAMPGTDGYEFIRAIRALAFPGGDTIPVIALTAFASAQDQKRAIDLGFNQHLSKPVDPMHLIEAIAETQHQQFKERRASEPPRSDDGALRNHRSSNEGQGNLRSYRSG
jgi:CheY-like chemotaxis protein/anti-sigma regulatory factor (Ser/Thr protein kinase)